MNLKIHYDNLYADFREKIQLVNFNIDEFIDSNSDDRYGVTLLFRPPIEVKQKIQSFLNELNVVDPYQYYYRSSDIHITVLSIISCYSGFKLDQINISDYSRIINGSIKIIKSFDINFKGITATLNGVMIQGFMRNNNLNDIRDNLRKNFRNSGLEESIDKRYALQTAHSTVVRFRKEVENKLEFVKVLEKYRDFHFGSFKVDKLEFVSNDWYQKIEKVKTLETFCLDKN